MFRVQNKGYILILRSSFLILHLISSSTKSVVEINYSLHLVEVICHLGELCVEKALLCCDNLKVSAAALVEEELCILYILGQTLHLLLLQLALLVGRIIKHKGVAHLATCREYSVLPCVVCLLLLRLCYFQTSNELSVGEDRLHETSYCAPKHLARINDTAATTVGVSP